MGLELEISWIRNHRPTSVRFPHDIKNITVFESDVGTLKSIFNGSSVNTKIELRNVRCLLPAKMTANFLKLEAREIAILLDRQKFQNAITN